MMINKKLRINSELFYLLFYNYASLGVDSKFGSYDFTKGIRAIILALLLLKKLSILVIDV